MENFRALLVDDEEELVSTLAERLGFRGFEADYAVNGSEALVRLRSEHFSVVVVDMKMPGISGLDLVKLIKREFPQLPVIMITGHGTPGAEQVEVPPGVFDCLPKPLSIDNLIQRMSDAVRGLK